MQPHLLDRLMISLTFEFPTETKRQRERIRAVKRMRENLTESQIDKIIEDTFPASDPPPWY